MTKQKYVIVDIHSDDAFYNGRVALLGTVVTLGNDAEDNHAHPEYISGKAYPVNPDRVRNLLDGIDYFYFSAVMLQTYEDNMAENGRVYHVGY